MGEEKQKSTPKFTYGNNYRRTRRETQFDTLDMAVSLKHKVSVYVMNDRYVPKRWRYINGKPAIDYARAIRDCISDSNDIFLNKEQTPERLSVRALLQEKALSYCNKLQLQLMDIIAECEGATDDNMREITDLLSDLIGKIIKWNKSDNDRISK